MDFVDRLLTCADCRQQFIFTAGEQLFFFDKQFKNDPKRCKPCKSRRATGVAGVAGVPAAAGISRTETRTLCSDCGVETTVPFKPTQGRPVLCRQCFRLRRPTGAASLGAPVAQSVPALPPVSDEPSHALPMPSASFQQATAELVAAASNAAAHDHTTVLPEAITPTFESSQA